MAQKMRARVTHAIVHSRFNIFPNRFLLVSAKNCLEEDFLAERLVILLSSYDDTAENFDWTLCGLITDILNIML